MAAGDAKYINLIKWIEGQILSGKFKAGDKFFSENELSQKFEISRQTVRHGIGILEERGILECRRGSGTYVIYGDESKRQRTRKIGLISTYLDSYIFPNIIRGIDTVMTKEGYNLQLVLTHNQVENEGRALRSMLEQNVDGIIIEPTKSGLPNPNFKLFEEIKEQKVPLIFFNAYYPGLDFHHVCMDDVAAGRMATECLIDAGHRQIAGIFQSDDLQGHRRYAGYIEALTKAHIEVKSSHVLWFSTEDIPYISEDMARIQRSILGCTGAVCYNDQIAYAIFKELKNLGINVPEDFSLVGVDNSELAVLCEVPLTSVAHPVEKLGEKVGNNIIKLIQGPLYNATFDFTPELVERESVKVRNKHY